MNVFERMKSYITSLFLNINQNVNIAEISLMDVYLEKILGILAWKSKEQTMKTFFWLNSLFWIILMLNLKFYGILSLICLHVFVYDMWCRDTLYSEYKGEYVELVQDVTHTFGKITNIFKLLRRDSPLMFSSSMAVLFLILRMISSSISGPFLSYILFLLTFLIPVGIKMLPEDLAFKLKNVLNNLSAPKCILAEDELIPFIQGKDFNRKDADLDSLLTDRTADSVTNSLASGISAMPSYLDVTESPRDIEEEDLLPRSASRGVSFTPGDLSSDSDSSDKDNREIRFDSDHFNTSSSEDDPFLKNLNFPKEIRETTSKDNADGIRSMISSVLTSVSGNLVGNMFRSTAYAGVSKNSSESDSDFEIVEKEDIDYNRS